MKRKTAFTLIELLVVIAIIAMLMAIILSVLGRSRQAAYRITCLNNLKQLGIATATYAQTYGFYPVCVPPDVGVKWSDFLADKSIAKNQELGVPVSLWPFHQTAALYNCPILSRLNCDISYCYDANAGEKLKVEVAALMPSNIPPSKKYENKYHLLKPQDVRQPAIFILLYDQPLKPISAAADVYDPYKDIDPDDSNNCPFLWRYNDDANAFGPHIGGHSILFGDGHTKWYKRPDDSSMSRSPR